jgi:hypothetical protein
MGFELVIRFTEISEVVNKSKNYTLTVSHTSQFTDTLVLHSLLESTLTVA